MEFVEVGIAGEPSRFWGMKLKNGVWEGENWLGRLLMEYRNELQRG
jgi:predicted NAD-dependent protein-ADP-ribosyltransferase YbiA (DUF1768 family)